MAGEYRICVTCGNAIVPPDVEVAIYGEHHEIEGYVHMVCTRKIERRPEDAMAGFMDVCPGCGAAVKVEGPCSVCQASNPAFWGAQPPPLPPRKSGGAFLEEAGKLSDEDYRKFVIEGRLRTTTSGSYDVQQPCSSCNAILTSKNRVDIKEFETLCYTCYSKKPKHICVDFDGVLAEYTGWKGPEHLGDPMPGCREFLKALKNMGYKVVIHTTRRPGAIQVWLRTHDLWHLVSDVTNQKIPALCYIDDRNICHEGDFDNTLEQVKNFLPYWRRPKA